MKTQNHFSPKLEIKISSFTHKISPPNSKSLSPPLFSLSRRADHGRVAVGAAARGRSRGQARPGAGAGAGRGQAAVTPAAGQGGGRLGDRRSGRMLVSGFSPFSHFSNFIFEIPRSWSLDLSEIFPLSYSCKYSLKFHDFLKYVVV